MGLLTDRLTPAALAAELGRTVATLKRWRRNRQGPPYFRVHGRVLYDRKRVEAWLAAKSSDSGKAE